MQIHDVSLEVLRTLTLVRHIGADEAPARKRLRKICDTPIEKRAPRRPLQRRREGGADLSNYHKTRHSPDRLLLKGRGARRVCVCVVRGDVDECRRR